MMNLKKLIVFFFLIGSIATMNAQEPAQASVVLGKALKEAKAGNKRVFLMFHASWCSWCKKMEANINSPACKKLFEHNYVMAYLTVKENGDKKALENPGGEALIKRYKGEKQGLPFWVILNADGKVLTDSNDSKGENLGCPSTTEEVKEFAAKLSNTSKLTPKQLETIAETFIIKKS